MSLTVLLVDDNPDHRFLTQRAIRAIAAAHDIKLVVAGDGEEALALAWGRAPAGEAELPALVLLDIKMPRLDGFEVLRSLRADARTARLPVVMFTSSENGSDIARARELGADDYVTKPLDPKAFTATVQATVAAWVKEARARRDA